MQHHKHLVLIILLILGSVSGLIAQDFPDPMQPPRLVNDFTGILNSDQVSKLENKLVAFNDSTSTQIAVVIVKSLNGYDKNDYAQRLGQKWGIGQKGKKNGIVILVKPKYPQEKGEASIQTGYGLEGVLPDITCKRIVENDMLPSFIQGDYYGGIDKATSTIISITKGEYTADQYNKRKKSSPYGILVPFIIMAIVFFLIRGSRGGTHSVGKISHGGQHYSFLVQWDGVAADPGVIFNPAAEVSAVVEAAVSAALEAEASAAAEQGEAGNQ